MNLHNVCLLGIELDLASHAFVVSVMPHHFAKVFQLRKVTLCIRVLTFQIQYNRFY